MKPWVGLLNPVDQVNDPHLLHLKDWFLALYLTEHIKIQEEKPSGLYGPLALSIIFFSKKKKKISKTNKAKQKEWQGNKIYILSLLT